MVVSHPQLRIFHEDWGRPGDAAVVAVVAGALTGAAWYRVYSEASHGDGFVDERTPELAVAVSDGYRGRGLGTRLLEALHERAQRDGIERISLSVDHDNPARRLYLRVGYVDVEPIDQRGRMLFHFRAP